MAQHYTNPKRATGALSLPDLETFYLSAETPASECPACQADGALTADAEDLAAEHAHGEHAGWYWWPCFPGCLPDSEASGPFKSEVEALEDARANVDDLEDDEDAEDVCRTCGARYADGGDGFDGECPSCADKSDDAE